MTTSRLPGLIRSLLHDEHGFILSAELVLLLTIGVLALLVGIHALAKSLNTEFADLAHAFGSLNQSFSYDGFAYICPCDVNAAVAGSGFIDGADHCDCAVIVTPEPLIGTIRPGAVTGEANVGVVIQGQGGYGVVAPGVIVPGDGGPVAVPPVQVVPGAPVGPLPGTVVGPNGGPLLGPAVVNPYEGSILCPPGVTHPVPGDPSIVCPPRAVLPTDCPPNVDCPPTVVPETLTPQADPVPLELKTPQETEKKLKPHQKKLDDDQDRPGPLRVEPAK